MSHDSSPVVLTLVMPAEVEDALIDTLLEHPDLAPGFTTDAVEGHGERIRLAGTAEEVRGRAAYCRVQHVTTRAAADTLLAILRERFTGSRVYFWITPVLAFGRLE
jgi:hypothetical protein